MADAGDSEPSVAGGEDFPSIEDESFFKNLHIEPGASSETMLLSIDSYQSMHDDFEDEKALLERKRSGTISEIEAAAGQDTPAWIDPSTDDLSTALDGISLEVPSVSDLAVEDVQVTEESMSCIDNLEWKTKNKHIFVLSQAGKPIYSRYGSEEKLVTLIGVMQALVSCVQDNQDNIRCIVAGDLRFVFGVHGPIILVAVCRSNESVAQLVLQLNYVYYQIVSVLTYSQLQRIFEKRQNYDLRRLLSGAEKFIDNLLNLSDTEPGLMLGSVRCLPLAPAVREVITQSIIQHCCKVKNLVFAILIAAKQLIALVRMKKYFLHPVDLHLIMNLVDSSESFRTVESWTPICLPKFDSSGYLHGHISYLQEDCDACLLLLTVDRDSFFTLSDSKKLIVERLLRYDCIGPIQEAIQTGGYDASQVGIPDLRHFLYKSCSAAQYTGPKTGPPYMDESSREYLCGIYTFVHHRMHGVARPLKLYFHCGDKETVMGWVTQAFELYSVFEPLMTKSGAVNAVQKLLRWIKSAEDRLFIVNSPVF